MARNKNLAWLRYALIALIFEKTIQHIVVTIAFYFNVNNLGAIFAVNPRLLMTVGAVVTILFALSLWRMVAQKKWAINLVISLALLTFMENLLPREK